jgi:hypothetical protein
MKLLIHYIEHTQDCWSILFYKEIFSISKFKKLPFYVNICGSFRTLYDAEFECLLQKMATKFSG